MNWRWHIGNAVPGLSIGAAFLILGIPVSWRGIGAMLIIIIGSIVGEEIRRPSNPTGA